MASTSTASRSLSFVRPRTLVAVFLRQAFVLVLAPQDVRLLGCGVDHCRRLAARLPEGMYLVLGQFEIGGAPAAELPGYRGEGPRFLRSQSKAFALIASAPDPVRTS